MSRVSKSVKTNVAFTVIDPTTSEDNCFGLEWDLTAKECSVCADVAKCGSVFAKFSLTAKKKDAEKKAGPFLDDAVRDMTKEQQLKAFEIISSNAEEGQPTSVAELVQYVGKCLKSKDEKLIVEALKKFKSDYSLSVKGGYVYFK